MAYKLLITELSTLSDLIRAADYNLADQTDLAGHGTQYKLHDGTTVSWYNTGTVILQGKNPGDVYYKLKAKLEADARRKAGKLP